MCASHSSDRSIDRIDMEVAGKKIIPSRVFCSVADSNSQQTVGSRSNPRRHPKDKRDL